MKYLILFILFALVLLVGCSSSIETAKDGNQNKGQEIYVFDDVVNNDSLSSNKNDSLNVVIDTAIDSTLQYIVQVGAFTTKDRAEKFVTQNQSKIQWQMKILYSDSVKLFVVQLPAFSELSTAVVVRNKLWETQTFRDAFLITK